MPLPTPEAHRRYCREYIKAHRQQITEYNRLWRKKNPERSRALQAAVRRRRRERAFEALGGCCSVCGLSDPLCLEIHHTNRDGKEERQRTYGAKASVRASRGDTAGLELLCANCHSRKTRMASGDAYTATLKETP